MSQDDNHRRTGGQEGAMLGQTGMLQRQDMTIEQFRATMFSRLREVAVSSMHDQHRVLVGMIVDLYGCVRQMQRRRPTPAERDTLARVIDQLKQYALKHFREEEMVMKRMSFPGLESHIRAHQKFVSTLLEVEERIWNTSVAYSIDLLHLVVGWLFEHINQVDMLYSRASQGETIDPNRFVPPPAATAGKVAVDTGRVDPQAFRQRMESRLRDVGVAQFNREHRTLLDQIIALHEIVDELRQRRPVEDDWRRISQLVSFLTNYTVTHFKGEEELMRKHQYPMYEQHLREHTSLLERMEKLVAAIMETRDIGRTVDMLFFLTEWFFNHTARTDTQYTEFFRGKSVA
jgi:hemerythrin-like metal-binding protein